MTVSKKFYNKQFMNILFIFIKLYINIQGVKFCTTQKLQSNIKLWVNPFLVFN